MFSSKRILYHFDSCQCVYISLFQLVGQGTQFQSGISGICNSVHVFGRLSVPRIPQNPLNDFLPIQEGDRTR